MSLSKPILVWFRRDLRLSDHAALTAASKTGAPVIPVFINDENVGALGAAPKWRLGLGLECFGESLGRKKSALVLRSGDALKVLQELIAQTGAGAVYWSRLYDPKSVARDSKIKATLREQGLEARSFGGHLMFEPWTVETKTGGMYKVYTPFWRAVKDRTVDAVLPVPEVVKAPEHWPDSERLDDWQLGATMRRGAEIVLQHAQVGEAAAQARLGDFMEDGVGEYVERRNLPAVRGTSGLSENLALGEISPHQCWHAGMRAMHEGKPGAETFLKEVVWREFAYHLMHHTPHILESNWKPDWDRFSWNQDASRLDVQAWMQGRTGQPFVDAAMREMYVTGKMHNRARMIAASYLTKHLLTHWKIGMAWFEDCLTDWDPASNAMGWQWCAGSGPDASPYFRIFNPQTQLEKFDPAGGYTHRWIAEGTKTASATALSYFDAVPKSWGLSPDNAYPEPTLSLSDGRNRALSAYETRGF